MQARRIEKINSLIKETLAREIEATTISEITMATITHVAVAPDIRQVTVLIEVIGDNKKQQDAINFLANHKKEFQKKIARLGLKFTPVINFKLDTGSSNVNRVEHLLQQIKNNAKD